MHHLFRTVAQITELFSHKKILQHCLHLSFKYGAFSTSISKKICASTQMLLQSSIRLILEIREVQVVTWLANVNNECICSTKSVPHSRSQYGLYPRVCRSNSETCGSSLTSCPTTSMPLRNTGTFNRPGLTRNSGRRLAPQKLCSKAVPQYATLLENRCRIMVPDWQDSILPRSLCRFVFFFENEYTEFYDNVCTFF